MGWNSGFSTPYRFCPARPGLPPRQLRTIKMTNVDANDQTDADRTLADQPRPSGIGRHSVPVGSRRPAYTGNPGLARVRHLAAIHLPDPVDGCPVCVGQPLCARFDFALAHLDRHDRETAGTLRQLLESAGVALPAALVRR